MRRKLLALCLAMASILAQTSWADNNFNVASGDWNTAGNWSLGHVPGSTGFSGEKAYIQSQTATLSSDVSGNSPGVFGMNWGAVLNLNSGANLYFSGDFKPSQDGSSWTTVNQNDGILHIGGMMTLGWHPSAGHAFFYQNGGTNTVDGGVSLGGQNTPGDYVISGAASVLTIGGALTIGSNGGPGTFIHSNGTVTLKAKSYIVQWGSGSYALKGGTLNLPSGTGNPLNVGSGNLGTLQVTGGTLTGGKIILGPWNDPNGCANPNGYMDVSTGTVTLTALQVGNPQLTGTAELKISGSASSITVNGSGTAFTVNTNATMHCVINTSGISPVNVNNSATVYGTMNLELSGFKPAAHQTFNLVTATSGTIATNGIRLATGQESTWRLLLVNSSKTLQAMYNVSPSGMTVFFK